MNEQRIYKQEHNGLKLPTPELDQATFRFNSGHVTFSEDGEVTMFDSKTSIAELQQIIDQYNKIFKN